MLWRVCEKLLCGTVNALKHLNKKTVDYSPYLGITSPEEVGRDDVIEDEEVFVPGLTASSQQPEREERSQEERDGEPHQLDLYLTRHFGGIVTNLQNRCQTILFSRRFPPKCANRIHSMQDHFELMNRFCCLPFAKWLERNYMDCLFRVVSYSFVREGGFFSFSLIFGSL